MTILLVRHAESQANVNEELYKTISDHRFHLTDKGREQAAKAGEFIENYLSMNHPDSDPRLWSSPYMRTTETALGIYQNSPNVNWNVSVRGEHIFFDDRLREREFGYFNGMKDEESAEAFPQQWQSYQNTMQENGKYYARPFGGESAADVSDRLRTFKEKLWRDIENGHKVHTIINHGFTLRCFVTSFLNLHPIFFAQDKNPSNTAVRLLDIDPITKRYADYGYIYDPQNEIYLKEKPAQPIIYNTMEALKL